MLTQKADVDRVYLSVQEAWRLVGYAKYRYLLEDCDPPKLLNCGLLVHWTRKQVGLWCPEPSPKLLLDLFESDALIDPHEQPEAGDLIFADLPNSRTPLFSVLRGLDVSHVGLMTGVWDDAGEPTVIHACWQRGEVVIESRSKFLQDHERNFRGYVRLPAVATVAA